MFSFPISEWIWPKCGYILKQIVFGSFDHPFQDGYKKFRKTDIVSLASPRVILELPSAVFTSVCQKGYQMLVFCWHVFWQIHKFQIHKLVSRRDHLNISTMYSALTDGLNALEKAPSQFMALRTLSGKGDVQIMSFRKLSGKCQFLLRFCTRNWSETYIITHNNVSKSPEER